jgi:hypothetical protein
MIEKNKCPFCKSIYEISWDDSRDDYYNSHLEDDDDCSYDPDEELYPEYCPFCGEYGEYGGESDSYDSLRKK